MNDSTNSFIDFVNGVERRFDAKELAREMRKAVGRAGSKVRAMIRRDFASEATALGRRADKAIRVKNLRYDKADGSLGFRIHVSNRRAYIVNRYGKELPLAYWAEHGVTERQWKGRGKTRRGDRSTGGPLKGLGFMNREGQYLPAAEALLMSDFNKIVERRIKQINNA